MHEGLAVKLECVGVFALEAHQRIIRVRVLVRLQVAVKRSVHEHVLIRIRVTKMKLSLLSQSSILIILFTLMID